jgi:hypothetical protein
MLTLILLLSVTLMPIALLVAFGPGEPPMPTRPINMGVFGAEIVPVRRSNPDAIYESLNALDRRGACIVATGRKINA